MMTMSAGQSARAGRDRAGRTADVAAEDEPPRFAGGRFAQIDLDGRGAQNVTGREEGDFHAIGNKNRTVKADAHKLFQ